MSSSKCARCDKTVYPVEGLRCLDKLWHKGCFKCDECNMTLNMKNYKGFEKRPYCNAHCPQAKATTVADTPEIRRLAENTRIQSQAKYHEDFEKSKGKGFTTVLDDPEIRRIKETSKLISNVAYHGEIERKKQMEERRTSGGGQQEDPPVTNNNNNNNVKHQNKMQSVGKIQAPVEQYTSPNHQAQQYQQQQRLLMQQQQQQQQKQQQQFQHQQYMQKQQMLLKQQQQYNPQNRQSAPVESLHHHQQNMAANPTYPASNNLTQQQHIMMRQQQQQQQIMMHQQRQSMDPSIPISRQTSKQAIITSSTGGGGHPQMKHPNMVPLQTNQAPIKYVPMQDPMTGQPIPPHLLSGGGPLPPHMMNHSAQMAALHQQQQRRLVAGGNPHQMGVNQHIMPNHVGSANGVMPKHSSAGNMQQLPPHMMQLPDQVQQLQQMRPASFAGQPVYQPTPNQVPRRVFRAMYDYVANDVDEVSFFENDILVDCVNVDRNWLIGKVARSGQTGMLPANYVAELPGK